ncbi:MAG: class I SAM-dependent methyltransferase [Solirubrobacterales bacterium]|nr:class I SAM-dependent methyltransferase [Solirubrobacterales bacterium]
MSLRELVSIPNWQMTAGERLALEGVLAELEPTVAIEVGTAFGGSLRRIAKRSTVVHSFDLDHGSAPRDLPNVSFHTGDSHELLPKLLAELADEGTGVNFALVDGDHTASGVERDLRDLISADALARAVILAHDAANPGVRRGIAAALADAGDRVTGVDLDLVAGHLSATGPWEGELWGGFALIVRGGDPVGFLTHPDFAESGELLAAGRDALAAQSRKRSARLNMPRFMASRRFGRSSR